MTRKPGVFRTFQELAICFVTAVTFGALLYVVGQLIGPTLPNIK